MSIDEVSFADTRELLVTYVMGNFRASKEYRRPYEIKWDKYYEAYNLIYDKTGKEEWQSTAYIPIINKCIEVISTNLYGALLSPAEYFKIKARKEINYAKVEQALIAEKQLYYDADKAQLKYVFMQGCKQAEIYGTGWLKTTWDFEEVEKDVKVPVYGFKVISTPPYLSREIKSYKTVRKKVVVSNNPKTEMIDIRNIYPDPRMIDFNADESWVIHHTQKSLGYILTQYKNGTYTGLRDIDVYGLKYDEWINSALTEEEKQNRRANYGLGLPMPVESKLEVKHDLVEFWGKVPKNWLEEDGDEWEESLAVVTIIDGKYLARRILNPCPDNANPVTKITYIDRPGEVYGMGVAEIAYDLQIEINEVRNQRMDNINLIINKMFALNPRYVENANDFVSKPGAILKVKAAGLDVDIRKIFVPIEMPDVTASSYKESFELERQVQEVTAATKATIGASGDDSNATARGFAMQIQQSGERFAYYARLIEQKSLKPLLEKYYKLAYQYRTKEDVIDIVGEELGSKYIPIPFEQLALTHDLVMTGVFTMENRGLKVAMLTSYAQFVAQNPVLAQKTRWDELAKMLWIEMGNTDHSQVFMSDQEMQSMGNPTYTPQMALDKMIPPDAKKSMLESPLRNTSDTEGLMNGGGAGSPGSMPNGVAPVDVNSLGR